MKANRLSTAVFWAVFAPAATFFAAETAPPPSVKGSGQPTAETTSSVSAVARPRIEVCFVLDTTGSMSGLIEGAKQKIWSIANELIAAEPTPELKIGLVAYRDRGDNYVTRVKGLTDDLDGVYGELTTFEAGGGGDAPESVNQALHDAWKKMSWSSDKDTLKIIFLVGDAPPQMKYQETQYPAICKEAAAAGIVINTVQCGSMTETTPFWKEIAATGKGVYIALEQSGGMAAIPTPYDEEIAKLSNRLSSNVIAYGDTALRTEVSGKTGLANRAAPAAQSDRAAYNAKNGGKAVWGGGDLIEEVQSNGLQTDQIKREHLPEEYRKLSAEELDKLVQSRVAERAEIQKEIAEQVRQREEFILVEKKKLGEADKDSFDRQVESTIRDQAKTKGIHYPDKPGAVEKK